MKTKALAIKSFLDNFQTALKQVKCETTTDHFLLDLMLEQHQKARYAWEVLNSWGEEANFELTLNDSDIAESFFLLNEWEKNALVDRKYTCHFHKKELLNILAPYLSGILLSAAVLAVAFFAFHVVLPLTLALATIATGIVVLPGCAALYFHVMEKHINHAITQIDKQSEFIKTYDRAADDTRAGSTSIATVLSDDQKKITLSTQQSALSFFEHKESNGSKAMFESITTCYNTTISKQRPTSP